MKASKKKRLYLPIRQYTASRHRTFLNVLCDHFIVVVSKVSPVALQSANIEWVEDILLEEANPPLHNVSMPLFDAAYGNACTFMKESLESVLAQDISFERVKTDLTESEAEFKTLYEEAQQFVEVARRRHIDFVVASCDYAYLSRPAVFMAKKLGITTVNVEHGYFGMRLNPTLWDPPAKRQRAISDVVVVDNALEAHLFEQYRIPGSTQTYLSTGTPMDHACHEVTLSRREALVKLGLNKDAQTIVLALSWLIPNGMHSILDAHDTEARFVDAVLSLIASKPGFGDVQVIIKLHPAVKNFGETTNVIRYYRSLASRYGMKDRAVVTATRFDDVLPAADAVIGWTMSSVLFDTAMDGTPVAQMLLVDYKKSYREDPNRHSEMAKAGLFKMLLSDSDLENYLKTVLSDGYRQKYLQKRDQFAEKWGIAHRTVEQKSLNFVRWCQQCTSR